MLIKLLFTKHKKASTWGFCIWTFYFCTSEASLHRFSNKKRCLCRYLHSEVGKVHSIAENNPSFSTSCISFFCFNPHFHSATPQYPFSFSLGCSPLFLASLVYFWSSYQYFVPAREQSAQVAFKRCFELWSDDLRMLVSLRLSCCYTYLNLGLNRVLIQLIDLLKRKKK